MNHDRDSAAPDRPRQKIVVVLGMHRSGTSVITRGLQELGVALGENLMSALPDNNPTGFWEDVDIFNLSERLLEQLGSRWDNVAPLDAAAWSQAHVTRSRLEAIDLLRSKMADCLVWGFKDPRTVRLLPFWLPVFDALGVAPCFVIVVRHPLSVARSLQARDAFAIEKSALLWMQHTLPAVAGTTGCARLVVDYDHFLDNPGRELGRIAAALDLPVPSAVELAASPFTREFLTHDLRHTRYEPATLDACPALAGLAKEIYTLLLEAAENRLSLDDAQGLDSWARAARMLREFDAFAAYLEDRERLLQGARANSEAMAANFAERDKDARRLETRLAETSQALAARESELHARVAQLESRDSRISHLNRGVADRDAKIGKLNRALAAERQQVDALHLAVAERDARLTVLHASFSWRLTAPVRLVHRVALRGVAFLRSRIGAWTRFRPST